MTTIVQVQVVKAANKLCSPQTVRNLVRAEKVWCGPHVITQKTTFEQSVHSQAKRVSAHGSLSI